MPDAPSTAFKALGHPHRLTIVRRLKRHELGCTAAGPDSCDLDSECCDFAGLVEELGISKSTVSHHLTVLANAGVIARYRDGRRLCCRLNREMLGALHDLLQLRVPQTEAE